MDCAGLGLNPNDLVARMAARAGKVSGMIATHDWQYGPNFQPLGSAQTPRMFDLDTLPFFCFGVMKTSH
jgi:hypothetical protein